MPDPRLDALLTAVRQQLALLEDARARPDVDRAVVAENALHFLLHAFRAAAEPADADLVAQIDAYLAQSRQARTHLLELGSGWRCASCGQRVPADAAVSGVRSGQPKLAIVCKACGAQSPATTDGLRALRELFSVTAAWDARASGFRWDGT